LSNNPNKLLLGLSLTLHNCRESQADRRAADVDQPIEVVALAAHRLLSAVSALAKTDSRNGRAAETDRSSHILDDNSKQTEELRASCRVRRLDGVAALGGTSVALGYTNITARTSKL